ncbi:S24 family peptidase [Deinococcus maricopensis]|uniref:Peptidase S24/S26A/S26B, conserved region n=1 Tax=Deinococcus maricopensis (strain DSM 21211 / LMG 22137 / NRRL B-23946 / LB-34) TaxID=709986 RepID=E8UBN0_DEIML|nr:S24 family peptidase [Deinococcus maricopensis]ADV68469.1 Peptidase S24/S26A/S26B, conserved region [Deinococcus maricopensis DSM 21211]
MHATLTHHRRAAPSTATILGFISAGVPLDATPFERLGRLTVPRAYRRPGMFAFAVTGDSMTAPGGAGLPHGAYVLVDTHDLITQTGHVYAFCLPGGEYVAKRLRLHRGRPAMYSDNPTYPPAPLTPDVRRVGRIYATTLDGDTYQPVGYRPWND